MYLREAAIVGSQWVDAMQAAANGQTCAVPISCTRVVIRLHMKICALKRSLLSLTSPFNLIAQTIR